ncbi:MAG: fumarylacetoacetate hydrolase family protein, partial [Bacteroidota bacterium]
QNLIFSFAQIITYVSQYFKLQMGDLIYTGTPAGVGPIAIGDQLEGLMMTKDPTVPPLSLLHCEIR